MHTIPFNSSIYRFQSFRLNWNVFSPQLHKLMRIQGSNLYISPMHLGMDHFHFYISPMHIGMDHFHVYISPMHIGMDRFHFYISPMHLGMDCFHFYISPMYLGMDRFHFFWKKILSFLKGEEKTKKGTVVFKNDRFWNKVVF